MQNKGRLNKIVPNLEEGGGGNARNLKCEKTKKLMLENFNMKVIKRSPCFLIKTTLRIICSETPTNSRMLLYITTVARPDILCSHLAEQIECTFIM